MGLFDEKRVLVTSSGRGIGNWTVVFAEGSGLCLSRNCGVIQ